ncbi:E3 ubiquitin-protein ligase TRIM56-like [Asterias amurensis]|uniref:E3 ubiquitin-protein ligase TRIM56-like n=1 Tax=Asterias amurensis TaxID=7602 RepID=UPI003AB43A3C
MDQVDFKKNASYPITAESILDKISQDYLKCIICLNTFTEPTFLDCHHTFCQSCLNDLRRSESHSGQRGINCPSCRKQTPLSGRDLSGLKQNFILKSLADDVTQQQKLLRVQQGALVCGQCNDECVTVIQCSDCDMRFCQDCWFDQESSHGDHEIGTLTSNEKAPKCPKHKDLDYCIYCQSCQVLLCAMCAATTHRSMDHVHIDIDQATSDLKEELRELISKADIRVEDFIRERSLLEYKMEEVNAKIEHEMTHIRLKYESNYDDPHEYLQTLSEVQHKKKIYFLEKLNKISAKVEWATHILDKIKDQMKEPSKYKLLQMSEVLEVRINDIIYKEFQE